MMVFMRRPVVLALLAMGLVACSEGDDSSSKTDDTQKDAPPEVSVHKVSRGPVENIAELPGRVQSVRVAEIRARVDGVVERTLYQEGSDVEAGDPLFRIDPREMQARLDSAEAILQRAEATAANAQQDLDRYEQLVADRAISRQDYDTAQVRTRTALADVAEARAAVATARLQLEYTNVKTPISGRAGRARVTEGALVSAADGTLLTTVEQFDPVFVNFSQSSADLLEMRHQVASGELELPDDELVPVQLVLENGREHKQEGYLNFTSMTIDESTGTVALRAQFPNPDYQLLPGQFVRARLHLGTWPKGITIPQRAVRMHDRGATVMRLDEDDVARVQEVELGQMKGGDWIILDGLEVGDRIIIDGWQQARADEPVTPVASERDSSSDNERDSGRHGR